MSSARLATLLLLPVLVGLDRFAYYCVRSVFAIHLSSRFAMPVAQMGLYFTALSLVMCAASVLGGALAIVTGPRVVALVGAVVAMLAYVAGGLGVGPGIGVGLIGLGVGFLRVAPWAILGDAVAHEDAPSGQADAPLKTCPEKPDRPFPSGSFRFACAPLHSSPRRFPMMTSMALLLLGAGNVASFLSPLVAGGLLGHAGAPSVYFLAAGVLLVVVLLACVLLALPVNARPPTLTAPPQPVYRAPAAAVLARPPPSPAAPLLILLALAASVLPYELALPVTFNAQAFLGIRSQVATLPSVIMVMVSFAGFVLFLAAALQRWSFSLLWPFGAALVLFGVGLVPVALASNALTFFGGSAVLAVAEPLVSAIGLTYAALAVGGRWRALTIATWLAVTTLASFVPAIEGLWRFELGLFAAMSIVFGALVIALGRRLHASAFEPPVVNVPGVR